MLESYISPFLLGYVDKYIKNLKPEDLQLSLWGGDLVLNKLDLRLDVLEQELNLPLTFISGHIHELRIHVPWTRLGYEPVVITINTIECALKLQDAGYDEHDSTSSRSSLTSKTKTDVASKVKQKYEKQDHDLPPGYVQSLMNRVINNVRLVIKNLVLKYVEDDIVLSVNVKSAESFAVNADWQSAFTELGLPELVLRRVCEFSDLTVCLDKRNASGKIEVYQEPMVYRCAVEFRIHMMYGSLHSNRPSILKVSVYCKELDVSISDTQLPMFIRLLELLIALYYGTLDRGNQLGSGDQTNVAEVAKTETKMESSQGDDPNSDGWASWAWSYVPDILYYDEEGGASSGKKDKRPDPILSVGLYCDKASITFKLTKQISADHPIYSTSTSKLAAYPLLRMELSGSAIEVLMRGEEFFVHQMGFSHVATSVVGDCVCGVSTEESEKTSEILDQNTTFFHCGTPDYDQKHTNYLTNSLFDENCPENKHQRASFILDWDTHQDTYSEALATQRFGAVWTDCLFVAEMTGSANATDTSSRSSHHSADDIDPIFTMKETASNRFLISPASLVVGSAVVHRLLKVLECATDHEYEPYSTPQKEIVDENRLAATPEQISILEDWVPSCTTHLTLLNLYVLFPAAEHPYYDSSKTVSATTCVKQGFQEMKSTPALCLQVDRIDIQTAEPMYPRQLVKPVSKLSPTTRSSQLTYHCYAHRYYKIFGCQFGLTYLDPSSDLSPPTLPIMPSWSAAVYHKELMLPMYWKDDHLVHSEAMLELPSISCSATKAQCLLMSHIANTWMSKEPETLVVGLAGTSLVEDVFRPSVDAFPSGQPVLQASLGSLELKLTQTRLVHAVSGTLSQVQVIVQALDQGRASDTPLFHGPVDTTDLHHCRSFIKQQLSPSQVDIVDLMTFTIQIPRMSESNELLEGSCGVFLVDIQGTAMCIDPIIYTWLLYQPRGQIRSKVINEMTPGKIQRAISKPVSSEDSSQLRRAQTNTADKLKSPAPIQRQSSTLSQPTGNRMPRQSRDWKETKGDEPFQKREGNLLEMLWLVLKQLTVQVDIQSSFIALPTDHLTFDPNTKSIPQCIREAVLARRQVEVAVVTLPVVKVTSLNHQKTIALQEVPVARKDLPPDIGEKLPWSVKASNCSIYTTHSNEDPHFILKPVVLSATVGVTSTTAGRPAGARLGLGLCIHADMQEIQMACSQSQVKLVVKLVTQALNNQSKLVKVFGSSDLASPQANIPTNQQSPSKSAPKVLSSVASSGQPENADTTTLSVSSPAETPMSPTVVAPLEEKDCNTPRLSLWLQWTLQKFCFSVYGGPTPMKISCEVEDLTTSLDFQDVYSKMTCKVGSLNVNHYVLREETWQHGPFCGVMFSCTNTITHNTCIRGLRPVTQVSPRPFNPFSTSHAAKPGDSKSHGFLSAMWTRAQGKSVAQKLSGKHKDSSKKSIDKESLASQIPSVHEIVISVQPFDVLLWCPLYLSLFDVFSVMSILESAGSKSETPEIQKLPSRVTIQCGVSTASILSPSDSYAKTTTSQKSGSASTNREWLSSRSLPLVYLDCKDIRVFTPTREGSSSGNDARVNGSMKKSEIDADILTDSQDTFLLQVNSICLRPHADNPLQRLVIKKDIFRRAVQAGQTQTPGSEIEDRQYQLDINDLSLSVASWDQIRACCDQGSTDGDTLGDGRGLVQNPALEWNMEQLNPTPNEVHLIPVVVGIDIRAVAAPAIVTEKLQGSNKRKSTPITVCGHSVEVDFTSDMTFYLSTGQVCLLQTLLQENFLALAKISHASPKNSADFTLIHQPTHDEKLKTVGSEKYTGIHHLSSPKKTPVKLLDSGLGSDDSAQIGVFKSQKPKTAIQNTSVQKIPSVSSTRAQKSRKISKEGSFTPLDALFTMGKVSVFLYSCENTATETFRLERSKRSQKLETIDEGRIELQPFIFVTVMQPAAILSLEHQHQKLEFTVYDFTVDGASVRDSARAITKDQLLPNPADYTASWFETCPGEPHPKTGVRPALLTFTVNDCLSDQVTTKLKIGRPTKLSFSLTNVDQATGFLRRLTSPKSIQIAAKPLMERECTSQEGAILIPILPHNPTSIAHGNKYSSSQSHCSNTHSDVTDMLARFKSISVEMTEFVVVMATVPDAANPHVVCSFSECQGTVDLSSSEGFTSEIRGSLKLDQLLVKTSVNQKTRPLIGPFNLNVNAASHWMPHCGNRVTAGVKLGHVTVFLGQEHVNCFSLIQQHLAEYTNGQQDREEILVESKTQGHTEQNPWFQLNARHDVICQQPDRHYKDDLRAGAFHYINDADGVGLRPKPGQIVFTSLALEDSSQGHWGSMTWCYPKPRIVTHVSVTPIPLHQAGTAESDIVTAEDEVPCTLEYWDDLKQAYIVHRQLYVSEVHSYHLTLPTSAKKASRQAVASTWRVVLNSVTKDGDDEPLKPADHPGLIVSPTALAASMRIDSCFAAHLLPMVSLGLNMECMEVRLAHHTDTLGKSQPAWLEPFVSDNLSPADQEFMVIWLDSSDLYVHHWSSTQAIMHAQMSTSVHCDLLTYRNLTMTTLLHPAHVTAIVDTTWGQTIECCVDLGSVKVSVGQEMVHTLNMAARAIAQANSADKERPLFCTYALCNDTSETLRFGQVHTDESVVLPSRKVHEYSWRTHKHHQQRLHVCIEGWRNWRWSEPFSLDREGTIVRTLQHKEQTATLFIKIKKISTLQKQVIFCGQHIFRNSLHLDLELQLIRLAKIGSQVIDTKHFQSLSANSSLPSLTCSDSDITGVRIKLNNEGCDWSEQFALTGEMSRELSVLKVSDQDGVSHYMWCRIFTETHQNATQRMVLFSPLFIIRNHLPWPMLMHIHTAKPYDLKVIQVKGRGSSQSLYQFAPDTWHNLTFQLGTDASPSSPPLTINTDMIDQLSLEPAATGDGSSSVTMETVTKESQLPHLMSSWPYNHLDYECKSSKLPPGTLHHAELPSATQPPKTQQDAVSDATYRPNTDLQISVTRLSRYLNTITVDVLPWCLMVNKTDLDIDVLEDGRKALRLGKGHSVAPQRFKEVFCLQLSPSNYTTSSKSRPIRLVAASIPSTTHDPSTLTLISEGYIHVTLSVSRMGMAQNKVVHLTVRSTTKHNIRVVTILPRFLLTNRSKKSLLVRALDTLSANKVTIQENLLQSVEVPPSSLDETVTPLTQWDISPSDQPITASDAPLHETQVKHQYLSLVVAKSEAANQKADVEKLTNQKRIYWSRWALLDVSRPRISVAVPINHVFSQASPKTTSTSETLSTSPLLAVLAEQEGVMYITLEDDPMPRVILANACSYPLWFGQVPFGDIEKVEVLEEHIPIPSVPTVLPHCRVHYDFQRPTLGTSADSVSRLSPPTIRLCLGSFPGVALNLDRSQGLQNQIAEEKQSQYSWSEAIQLATDNKERSEIISIVGIGYVLVSSHLVGSQLHIRIDPLSMDVSKTSGSGGIKLAAEPPVRAVPNPLLAIETDNTNSKSPNSGYSSLESTLPSKPLLPLQCRLKLSARSIILMIMDEVSDLVQHSEMLRVTVQDVHLLSFPVPDEEKTNVVRQQQVQVSAGACQIDNQSFKPMGRYDFAVILCNQNEATRFDDDEVQADATFEVQAAFIQKHHAIVSQVLLESCTDLPLGVASLNVALQPFELYVEDQLLYDLLVKIQTFIPAGPHDQNQPITKHVFPEKVRVASRALKEPIGMRQFLIQPIRLLASVHASLKLFIAVDSTPLSFEQFDSGPMFATTRQLIQALTMHYTSGALFKAGWVLGSLEILGNPAGLLRNVRSGLTDSVMLPYEGLTRGPAAFVAGVTSGTSSLLKHLSAGTLTSITMFASSVSRNLDRLTLDADHIARREKQRRKVPDRVTDGLLQGLSGFGVSLLGAIGGIADQPLRSFNEAPEASSPTQKATGVIRGVGKGLMGVVIKPLGGAAEFVSQTGQGILHSTGLIETRKPKGVCVTSLTAMANNSRLKYTWKMLQSLPNADILIHCEITTITFHGLQRGGVLLLTPEVLFVVSASEDTQQQAFPVFEVECGPLAGSQEGVCVKMKSRTSPSVSKKEETCSRVADFVGAIPTRPCDPQDIDPLVSSDSQSEVSSLAGGHTVSDGAETTVYQYFLQRPYYRETFLSLFRQAKNRLVGKGFCYDETHNAAFSRFKMWHASTKMELEGLE